MTNFEKFSKDFDELVEKEYDDSLYEYMDAHGESNTLDFGEGKLIANNDVIEHDSYGSEDSFLRRIFQFGDYGDIYIQFNGTRSSYNGEDWTGYHEVKPATRSVEYFEEVKQ